MRRPFNGLGGLARDLLGATPASRDLFVLCNRGRNRLKVLVCDESGVWLHCKRLDQGTFAWPSPAEVVSSIEYREEKLLLMLRRIDVVERTPRRWGAIEHHRVV